MSLVLGIIALLVSFFINPLIGIILAIIGIILGALGIKRKDKIAIAGVIVSIITIVITIILTISSVGMVTSTIDNSRKDLFGLIAQDYINSAKNSVLGDKIECSSTASEDVANQFAKPTNNGDYYLFVSSSENALTSNSTKFSSSLASKAADQTEELVFSGNKSPWANIDTYGYIHIKIEDNQPTYYIALADVDGHGIINEAKDKNIRRDSIEVKNAKVDIDKVLNSIGNSSNYYCHIK